MGMEQSLLNEPSFHRLNPDAYLLLMTTLLRPSGILMILQFSLRAKRTMKMARRLSVLAYATARAFGAVMYWLYRESRSGEKGAC